MQLLLNGLANTEAVSKKLQHTSVITVLNHLLDRSINFHSYYRLLFIIVVLFITHCNNVHCGALRSDFSVLTLKISLCMKFVVTGDICFYYILTEVRSFIKYVGSYVFRA